MDTLGGRILLFLTNIFKIKSNNVALEWICNFNYHSMHNFKRGLQSPARAGAKTGYGVCITELEF